MRFGALCKDSGYTHFCARFPVLRRPGEITVRCGPASSAPEWERVLPMPRRRVEDRIHDLCQRANERDWCQILSELRRAIREHALRVGNRSAAAVVGGQPHLMRVRREGRDLAESWFPQDSQDGQARSG